MSDLTPRDQLAQIINKYMEADVPETVADKHEPVDADYSMADAIVNAGWRPPARTVTTVEELDALAKGTVVLDAHGRMFQKLLFGWEASGYVGHFDECARPATVLWEPDEGEGEEE